MNFSMKNGEKPPQNHHGKALEIKNFAAFWQS